MRHYRPSRGRPLVVGLRVSSSFAAVILYAFPVRSRWDGVRVSCPGKADHRGSCSPLTTPLGPGFSGCQPFAVGDLFLDEVRAAGGRVGQGGVGDHQGDLDAVAEADEGRVDARLPVEFLDAVAEVLEVGLGPLEALARPDDAGVVPHRRADGQPVLVDQGRVDGLFLLRVVPAVDLGGLVGPRVVEPPAMSRAARVPQTSPSRSEVEARRLAPWTPVQETSPTA